MWSILIVKGGDVLRSEGIRGRAEIGFGIVEGYLTTVMWAR